jgi:2-keto-3-deoxy-L-rhamnonate aldolase RhmA
LRRHGVLWCIAPHEEIQMRETAQANAFLERLRSGELTLMMAIRSARTTEIVRIAKATGHHAVMVDLEHSAIDVGLAGEMCAAAGDLGLTPFVRVPERDYGIIGRLLDSGASGIVAPRIETVEEAAAICRACRFPPAGQRSQLAMVPQYGMRPMAAIELNPLLDTSTIVQALLETPAGIEAADAIAALPGIDMLSIGANDLCAELGIAGQFSDAGLRKHIAKVAEACKRHSKLFMLGGISDLDIVKDLLPLGIAPLFLTGTDTDMLYSAAEQRSRRISEWHRHN